jgi:hypothetical protein
MSSIELVCHAVYCQCMCECVHDPLMQSLALSVSLFLARSLSQTNAAYGARGFMYGTAVPGETVTITGLPRRSAQGIPYPVATDSTGAYVRAVPMSLDPQHTRVMRSANALTQFSSYSLFYLLCRVFCRTWSSSRRSLCRLICPCLLSAPTLRVYMYCRRWKVQLDPYQETTPPTYTATLTGSISKNTIVIREIVYGDVFLCGGQVRGRVHFISLSSVLSGCVNPDPTDEERGHVTSVDIRRPVSSSAFEHR